MSLSLRVEGLQKITWFSRACDEPPNWNVMCVRESLHKLFVNMCIPACVCAWQICTEAKNIQIVCPHGYSCCLSTCKWLWVRSCRWQCVKAFVFYLPKQSEAKQIPSCCIKGVDKLHSLQASCMLMLLPTSPHELKHPLHASDWLLVFFRALFGCSTPDLLHSQLCIGALVVSGKTGFIGLGVRWDAACQPGCLYRKETETPEFSGWVCKHNNPDSCIKHGKT